MDITKLEEIELPSLCRSSETSGKTSKATTPIITPPDSPRIVLKCFLSRTTRKPPRSTLADAAKPSARDIKIGELKISIKFI
jgi:hypothetical protein